MVAVEIAVLSGGAECESIILGDRYQVCLAIYCAAAVGVSWYYQERPDIAAINVVFGNFLEPRLMGYGVGISPLVVFVGLVAWGWIFGPVGMLLSVPLSMTLKLALESDERTRWVAIFIGSQRDAQHTLAVEDDNASG